MVEMGSMDKTYIAACRFIECLTALPNLHTLETTAMPWNHPVDHILDALEERKPRFQQVRTLVLPNEAHWLMQCCPNIEDLTCYGSTPYEAFVKSLVVGQLNRITKLSILFRGSVGEDPWPSRVYFISLIIDEANS